MRKICDITYYKNQNMNLYLPDNGGYKSIVFIHGGGITSGNRESFPEAVFKYFTNRGYGFYSLEYSLYPNCKFPEFLVECAEGIKFVLENNKKYGGDVSVYVYGQSAGAYILMMLCSNRKYLQDIGVNPKDIKGWISECGQLFDHFEVMSRENHLNPWLQRISELSPIYFVDENFDASPIFLIINENDEFLNRDNQNINYFNSVKFFNKNVDIELVSLKGGHCSASYDVNSDGIARITPTLESWLKKH